jgi:hypothetical protein
MWQRQQKFFKIAMSAKQPIRTLMLQEHNGMSVLQDNGVRVPPFGVAKSAEEAYQQANKIGFFFNNKLQIFYLVF